MEEDRQYLKDYNEFLIENPEFDIKKLPAIWKNTQIKLDESIPDEEVYFKPKEQF